ncbi:MAG: squalene synthase HpnC [Planctomycetes bacterium]|nr:squalene synthase HpnC [Planctomycetota bacterium]
MATLPPATAGSPIAAPAAHLELAARHYENFPVGSWLLPAQARRHLHRIYAFARTADDLADELRDPVALAAFRAEFLRHLQGGARDVPLFADLCATIAECRLEPGLFTDLLDAFAQDCVQKRYDLPQLLDYCRRSADPVGRLVLRVHGVREPGLDRLSDTICTALQLLNHLQDLGSDLATRDRIYFPAEDLARFGVGEADLRAASAGPGVRAFVRHWAERLGRDFASGWPLCARVRGRLRCELRAILRGAAAVLRRMRAVDFDVLGGRVHLTKWERVRTVFGGLLLRSAPDFGGGGA